MPAYESTVFIAAPKERIWTMLADVGRWHEWTPTITRIESIGSKSLGLGARFKVLQPKLRPAVWTVTDLEPLKGFTWESRSPGMRVVAEHAIHASTGTESKVILRVTFSGFFGAVVGRLLRGLTKSYLAKESASLKQRVETLT
jgi:hypothetical protein